MLHLGLGSFHRAHQAAYLQALIDAGDTRWSIVGTNIRPEMAELLTALQGQDGAYTLETVSPAGQYRYQRIESIRRVLPYDATLASAVEVAALPSTRIISFTVTEAGYYLDPTGQLDTKATDIVADVRKLQSGEAGSTVFGAVAAMLRKRMSAGAGPVTLLNCDNLRHNGERFRSMLHAFLDLLADAPLLAWMQANTSCPNSMVDRITPRPPPELRDRVRQATGWDDAAPVGGESFIQWVIEDDFANGRPEWERVGVQMVQSVAPYEEAKIRILNGSHSCIAWAGTLAGMRFIHEGARDPTIRQLAYDYITDDVIACLDRPGAPSPVNLPDYRDVVLERFGNEAVRDTNQRVAMDAFSKIPGFIAPTIRERLAAGQPISSVAVLPALFLGFLQRWHAGALPYEYQDQAMDPAVAHAMCDAPDPVAAFCGETSLWNELAGDARLVDAVRQAMQRHAALVGGSRP
ncbi:MAG: mannitol dehydrogenase family protein [Proteobacteria bacterium]|nr:mannitol dehydrogenase family protein [Pseudomonadota bacterium]